jgi:di/tripeptidase
MNLNKFKELLSVPTKTYKESKMVEYLISTVGNMDGVTLTCDEYNNIYAVKGTLDKGEFYPMFISHTDTVHELVDLIDVKEEYLIRPYTFGKDFGNEQTLCLKAYDKDGNPTGIGGDDKCGIFICMELLQKLDKVKVAFFVSEETGCHGSKMVDKEFLKDVGYCVQYDAPGDHLISYSCMGTVLFDSNGKFIQKALPSIERSFGNEMLVQSHPYTDIMMIKQKSDLSCLNMSCGYYNMHTKNEFVCLYDVERAIIAGLNLVKDLGLQKYEFKYEPNKPSFQYDIDFTKDEDDEVIHNLESIDIVEINSGIIIVDPYDNNEFYIDDEDGLRLFEILKGRYC